MKNLVLILVLALASVAQADKWRGHGNQGNQYGGETYSVYTNRNNVAICDDVYNGGQRGGRLQYCVDIGHGNNHGCSQIANGCQAWEGNGNNGTAACQAVCRKAYNPYPQGTFYVHYYGSDLTRCDGPGGRPGARAVSCVDVAHGHNHGCTLRYDGCQAWEGNGNGGNAACDAQCR